MGASATLWLISLFLTWFREQLSSMAKRNKLDQALVTQTIRVSRINWLLGLVLSCDLWTIQKIQNISKNYWAVCLIYAAVKNPLSYFQVCGCKTHKPPGGFGLSNVCLLPRAEYTLYFPYLGLLELCTTLFALALCMTEVLHTKNELTSKHKHCCTSFYSECVKLRNNPLIAIVMEHSWALLIPVTSICQSWGVSCVTSLCFLLLWHTISGEVSISMGSGEQLTISFGRTVRTHEFRLKKSSSHYDGTFPDIFIIN